MPFSLDELRPLELFAGLPDEHLAWFREHGVRVDLAADDRMFEHEQPADYLFLVVAGLIERFEKIGGQWLKVAVTHPGQVTGMLPYSRMTKYPGHAVAAKPTTVLRVNKSDFPSMLETSEQVGQRLVAIMSDRVRGDVRLEQQSEKMQALGRLSAGLAHELNNPAAAVRRAAKTLLDHRDRLAGAFRAMVKAGIDESGVNVVEEFVTSLTKQSSEVLSALERSDREDQCLTWLERHGVHDGWDIAAELTDAGATVERLDVLAADLDAPVLHAALAWLSERVASDRLIDEIASATARMSELVGSIKTYSHMDRSVEHKPTDVREGLDNTVTMMGHKIKAKGIGLERDYQHDLPAVPGNAGELNQVWTNLIDNAIDAMHSEGRLELAARAKGDSVEVRVVDDGAGIPEDVQPHVFEPFFTTKDVGEGTGLGLDVALRIVRAHQGQIEIESRPGRTMVRVLLPRSPRGPVPDDLT